METLEEAVVDRLWRAIVNDPQYLLIEARGVWAGPRVDVLFGAFESLDDYGPRVTFKRLPGDVIRRGEWLEPIRNRPYSLAYEESSPAHDTTTKVRRWVMCNAYAVLDVDGSMVYEQGLRDWWPIQPSGLSTAGLALFRM